MSMIRKFRAWSGKKFEEFLWRYVQPKVRGVVESSNSAVQQSLQQKFAQREHELREMIHSLELQMNFQPGLSPGWQKRVTVGDSYAGFENIFRDSVTIAKRNERYLPFFAKAKNMLDVGCGRGEFLELLQKEGIAASGIDSSPEMVEMCREKGLKNVEVAQAVTYLSSLPEHSQDGIFSCHVLEHLPVDDVIKFFPLAWKSLAPGGTLVVETPNPHSLPAFKLFWLDPTHVRPLFPEFLEWAARAGGFTSTEILYLTEDGFSPTHGPWYGNYALVAHKETGPMGASSAGNSASATPSAARRK